MQYELEAGGRRRVVSVTRAGAGFAVAVDGRTRYVDVAQIDTHTLSLLVDGMWSKDAVIVPGQGKGHLSIVVNGMAVEVTVSRGRRAATRQRVESPGADAGVGGLRRPARNARNDGIERVTAPMPGKVLRVMARPGEAVRSHQPLVVVEAMKMENELRAARDGVVAEVHATEGQSVDAGALLIVIQ